MNTNGDDGSQTGSTNTAGDEEPERNRLSLCQECQEQLSIYQCPCCMIRTCSLQCCQQHKKKRGCTGKRNRSTYLALCHMNDNTLRSDYFFLEKVLNEIPRANKIAKMQEENSHRGTSKNASKKLKRLMQQATKRYITLQTMPSMMERHKKNYSWYCGPRDMITWKIEVIVMPSRQSFAFSISENEENILSYIAKRIPTMDANDIGDDDNDGTSQTTTTNDYRLFMKRLPNAANRPRYIELNANVCLRKALQGMTIIEHPTIYCVSNTDDESIKLFPTGTDIILEQPDVTGNDIQR